MLEELPIEIIEHIALFLPSRDLLQFRGTSTTIYSKTNAYCARLLFHTINTDLSFDELHWLSSSLTTNRQICRAVQKFRIVLKDEKRGLGAGYYWHRRNRDGELILPCDGFEALQTLFGSLKHCRRVEVHARDKAAEVAGPNHGVEPADVLQLLVLSAAETNATFESIEVGSREQGIHLNADRLPVETLKDPNVVQMLADLEVLTMNLIYSDELVASGWLSTFFGGLIGLKYLAFDLDMAWGEVEVTEEVIQSLKCSALHTLHLSRFKTSLTTLDAFTAQSHETLRSLSLRSVTIVSGSSAEYSRWKSWLKALPHRLPQLYCIELDLLGTTQVGHGKSHLHFSSMYDLIDVGTNPPPLERVNDRMFKYVASLPVDLCTAGRLEVFTHGWVSSGRTVFSGVRYEGPDMREALEFIAENAADLSVV